MVFRQQRSTNKVEQNGAAEKLLGALFKCRRVRCAALGAMAMCPLLLSTWGFQGTSYLSGVNDVNPLSSHHHCGKIAPITKEEKAVNCDDIYTFDCHVSVCRSQLLDLQIKRYEKNNLHEPFETKIFAAIVKYASQDNDIFVDIGAAIGYYMILANKLNPNVYSYGFNPSTSFQQHVRLNVELNKKDDDHLREHVCLDPRAVTSEDNGQIWIGDHFGDGARTQKEDVKKERSPNYASTVRLDTFLREQQFPQDPFLVMIDIQGAELAAIQAIKDAGILASGKIPMFFVGIHGTFEEIKALFEASQAYDLIVEEPKVEHQPDGIIIAVSKSTEKRRRMETIVKVARQHLDLPYDTFLETVGAKINEGK